MSVVNSMLRNLDERQLATAQVLPLRESLPEEVKVAREQPRRLRPGILIATVVISAALAAALYLYEPKPGHVPVPVAAMPVEAATASIPGGGVVDAEATTTSPLPVASQASLLQDKPVDAKPLPETHAELAAAKADEAVVPAIVRDATTSKTRVSAPELNLALALSLNSSTPSSTSSLPAATSTSAAPGARVPSAVSRKPAALSAPTATIAPTANTTPQPASIAGSNIVVEQAATLPAQSEVQRALDLQRRGQLVEAEARLRAVLDDDKNMVEARQALIALLTRQQRDEEVRRLMQEGVALAPTQSAMVMQYARFLAARSEWKAASEVLTPASSALARDADYRALTGAVLQRLGRFSQSVEAYQAALRIAPGVGAWWVGMGLSLEADGRLAEARDAYQQARTRDVLTPDVAQFVESKLTHLP